jgi:hypothetical protein
MAKAGLFTAVCTVALLAAVPAFAQTGTQPGDTGPGNTVNTPAAHDQTGANGSTMSPAPNMGASADDQSSGAQSSGAMNHQSTHRSAMTGRGVMRGRDDTSQNAVVDRLNDQSFQAAQSGQTYGGSNMAPGGMGATGAMPGRSPMGSGGSPSGSSDGGGGGGSGGSGM